MSDLEDRLRALIREAVLEFNYDYFNLFEDDQERFLRSILSELDRRCLCTVGVQECELHPGRLNDKEKNIAFRKSWDARVVETGIDCGQNR